MSIFQALRPGDHVVAPDDAYHGVTRLLRDIMAPWGLEYTRVDMRDPQNVAAALRPNTRLVWIETPSNPLLKIADIAAIADIAIRRVRRVRSIIPGRRQCSSVHSISARTW
jgi:cystathionine gamma-synthase